MKIDLSELVSQQEAAKMRGVSTQAIRHLMKHGRLTVIVVGGWKFLFRKEVEAFEPSVGGRPRSPKTAKGSSASKTKSGKKKRVN